MAGVEWKAGDKVAVVTVFGDRKPSDGKMDVTVEVFADLPFDGTGMRSVASVTVTPPVEKIPEVLGLGADLAQAVMRRFI